MAEKPEHIPKVGRGTADGTDAARQTGPARNEHARVPTAVTMEEVVCRENMTMAYRRVVSNKGAAGVDGVTVDDLHRLLWTCWEELKKSLLNDSYEPPPVRKVEIPKPGGKGVRMLGIPTVIDRLIQQALLQVLQPLFDPTFSDSSFGFRPGRSAHEALDRAKEHLASGHRWVVDMDLEKFFDRVHHDVLMSRLARRIEDKRILKLIRRFLQAGMLEGGVVSQRVEGTPQGGPLSPLLSNVLLDELDKELERRGHRFVRYADDCNIYVRSRRSGERVLTSIDRFLTKQLRLVVNRSKSAVETQVSRLHVHMAQTAAFQGGSRVGSPTEGPSSRDVPSWSRPPAVDHDRGHETGTNWLGKLLPQSRSEEYVRGTRPVDSPQTTLHPVASVEATHHASSRTNPPRSIARTCAAIRDEWPRSVVECWRQPHEPRGPDSRLNSSWTCESSFEVTAVSTF